MSKRTVIAAALISLAGAGPAMAQYLSNGSFEQPVIPAGTQGTMYFGGQTLPGGWSVIAGATEDVHLINASASFPFESFSHNMLARDGNQWLDLSGEGWGGFNRGVAQSFAATPGDSLTLAFSVGNLVNGGFSYVQLKVNGNVVDTFASKGADPADPAWTQVWADHSVSFVAQATNVVEFIGVDGPGTTPTLNPWNNQPYFSSHWSIGLDNVSISSPSPVPEPSSYAMALVGLILMGGVAHRRRRG